MPKEIFGPDYQFLHRDKVLTFEEITRLTRLFVSFEVKKIRLTGGEPLVRPQRAIEPLLELIHPYGIHSWQVQITVAMGRAADEPDRDPVAGARAEHLHRRGPRGVRLEARRAAGLPPIAVKRIERG